MALLKKRIIYTLTALLWMVAMTVIVIVMMTVMVIVMMAVIMTMMWIQSKMLMMLFFIPNKHIFLNFRCLGLEKFCGIIVA